MLKSVQMWTKARGSHLRCGSSADNPFWQKQRAVGDLPSARQHSSAADDDDGGGGGVECRKVSCTLALMPLLIETDEGKENIQ